MGTNPEAPGWGGRGTMASVFQEDATERVLLTERQRALPRGGGALAEGCGDTEVGSRESSRWNAEAVKENSLLTPLPTPDVLIFHTQPCYGSL